MWPRPRSIGSRGALACPRFQRLAVLETHSAQAAGILTERTRRRLTAGEFDQTHHELGVEHTRTRPRPAWTNGFVERLQGTILTELWSVEFWRRFFTSPAQLQVALDRCLGFYNHPTCRTWGIARMAGRRRPSSGTLFGGEIMTTSHTAKVPTPTRNWTR